MIIGKRVAALEQRKRGHRPVNVPLIAAQPGEASDHAVARYVAEHGPLDEVDEGQVNAIVLTFVHPDPALTG